MAFIAHTYSLACLKAKLRQSYHEERGKVKEESKKNMDMKDLDPKIK
jgi:hypothetical protein